MHTVFQEVFFISEKQLFCYEIFKRNDIQKLQLHIFSKKSDVWWLRTDA